MSYESIVYRILIASPSDVEEEREVAARVIQDWNDLNSFNKKIVLLPVRWETHSSPSYGVRPQEAINKQIVDDCDLLIGFFWTKIGTPTGIDISGTIEEIKRVSNADKPVMLYFSKRGKDPSQIDLTQLESLNKFKEEVYKIALVENFNSIVDFRDKISRQLEMKIRELQERKESSKESITFSFIDGTSGKLIKGLKEVDIERIEVEEKKVTDIIQKNKKLSENKWYYQNHLASVINKKNNIPIILGLENNLDRVLGNSVVDLKIKASTKDSLRIETIGDSVQNEIFRSLHTANLTQENELVVRKLFSNSINRISSNTWELSFKPFSLLPNKSKTLDSVLLLYPRENTNVDFSITLFSESILQTIERACKMKINVRKKEMSVDEIKELFDKVPDPDELPF